MITRLLFRLFLLNEALIQRKVLSIPEEERYDLNIDITPREALASFLETSFPMYVYQQYEEDGITRSALVTDSEGNPVISKAALKRKKSTP